MRKNRRPPVTLQKINAAKASAEEAAFDLVAYAERYNDPLRTYETWSTRRRDLLRLARRYEQEVNALTKVRRR